MAYIFDSWSNYVVLCVLYRIILYAPRPYVTSYALQLSPSCSFLHYIASRDNCAKSFEWDASYSNDPFQLHHDRRNELASARMCCQCLGVVYLMTDRVETWFLEIELQSIFFLLKSNQRDIINYQAEFNFA